MDTSDRICRRIVKNGENYGNQKQVITFKHTYAEALKDNNIVIGSKDKTSVPLDSKVKNGQELAVKKAVNVRVNVDGKMMNIKTAENTVDDMMGTDQNEEFDAQGDYSQDYRHEDEPDFESDNSVR